MGKFDQQQLPVQQQRQEGTGGSRFICGRCSVGLSRLFRHFSFKCVVVLLLSVAVFVSAFFWVLPFHYKQIGFDANRLIKQSASAQSYFKLQKPVSDLVPHIARLEYDINEEIGVPDIKVAVLSMHRANVSNWTDVVVGFLADPLNASLNPMSFSVLRSSLIDLFLQQSNLTLTNSTFGRPSSFEILKLSGGITIIPKQCGGSVSDIPQIFFNFTLVNSISQINDNHIELKEQLKLGLTLTQHENIYVQVTNKDGSTRDPPVVVEASVTSNSRNMPLERLKELAQIIKESPSAKNLGLNHSVFGKVKEVRLSSYLNHTMHALPPSPSPSPSPMENDYAGPSVSPFPAHSPSYSPEGTQPPNPASEPPISSYPAPAPWGSQLPPSPSPTFHAPDLPPQASNGPSSHLFPGPSPLPAVSYGSRRNRPPPPVAPAISPFPSSSAVHSLFKELQWFCLFGLLLFHLLCSTL